MKSLPNILSIFRICLVPAFVAVYALDGGDIKYWAISIFIIANISDILDGYIARKCNAQTGLGKVLDPLGDKLMTFAALVCISISIPALIWAPCVYFVKEILMGIGGLLLSKKAHLDLPHSNWLGKTATVYFFLVCVSMMVFGNMFTDAAANALMASAVGIALAAFIYYLYTFVKLFQNRAPQENVQAPREYVKKDG